MHIQKRLGGYGMPGSYNVLDRRRPSRQLSVSTSRSSINAESFTPKSHPEHNGVAFKDREHLGQDEPSEAASASPSDQTMPALCRPPDFGFCTGRLRRPIATSLGSESAKTAVSGVSEMDPQTHHDMSHMVTGMTGRDRRRSPTAK